MDARPPIWDADNRLHVIDQHADRGLSQAEVNEVLEDVARLELREIREGVTYHQVLGRTAGGRLLFVVWVDHPKGRYPVHARPAGRRTRERFSK